MPVIPGQQGITPIPPGPNTVLNVVTNALVEIGWQAVGEPVSAEDGSFGLSKFNQLLDSWNAVKEYIFSLGFTQYVLTPNLQPHTIGPAAIAPAAAPTFLVVGAGARPLEILNANIILNNVNPVVRVPLEIRDDVWWANQRVQGIKTTLPTDLYYSPDWPLGRIFLWPVPTTAYGLELETPSLLAGAAKLSDSFAFPPGYELAVTLTLAELLIPPGERAVNPMLVELAKRARLAIQGQNAPPPRISLIAPGLPRPGKPQPTFNWRTGMSR